MYSNASLELNQLTLTGGKHDHSGGGLLSFDGSVNVLDTTFEHNASKNGGGVFVWGASTLNMFNVQI